MDDANGHWQGYPDHYDVLWSGPADDAPADLPDVYRPVVEEALRATDRSGRLRSYEHTVIPAALPLDAARELLLALYPGRIRGILIPVRYRTARIDLESARRLAQVQLEEARRIDGHPDGALGAGRDDLLWWTFVAPDSEAQRAGLIPGAQFFSIDKWDGHLADRWERHALARFSRGVRADTHWRGQPDHYDISIQIPPTSEPALPSPDRRLLMEAVARHIAGRETLVPFARPLAEARALVQTCRQAGAVAGLVPTRYRLAPISAETAHRAAREHVAALRRHGALLGEPDDGRQGAMWWSFAAPRLDGRMARPGASPHASTHLFIRIDGWDGHVVTEREMEDREWFNDPQV